MGCACHLLRGETCSHCNKWFDYFEPIPDDIIDPIPGDTLVMLTLDTGGASVDKEAVLTLQQAKARKIAERNKRLAQELAHTFIPHSDPDGRPHHLFGNKIIQDQRNAFDHTVQSIARKRALAHRIPFAWRSKSIRDDLRMGTVALFGPTPEGDDS